MKNFGEIFSRLCEDDPRSITEVSDGIGIKRTRIYELFKKESGDTETIDKICRYFEISPMVFFEPDLFQYKIPSENSNEYNNTAIIGQATMNIGLLSDVQNLKSIIAEKERFIQFLLHGKDAAAEASL